MTKWMLAAGAAALAMTAPALADKGGKGHGNGGSNNQSSHAQGGNGHGGGKAQGGREKKHSQSNQHAQSNQRAQPSHGNSGHARDAVRVADKGRDRGRDVVKVHDNGKFHEDVRKASVVRIDRDYDHDRFVPRWDSHGLVRYDGCPPGLAKKGNGCLPPGQAKKIVGMSLSSALASRVLGGPYRDWYRDNDRYYYRWDDDYIYRVNRNGGLIDALFPYANRDYYYYPVGYQYPSSYNYYNVPYQYRTYYPDRNDMWYRYGDGAIYSVSPSTGLIQGIAALLAGDLSVGQPLPPSYSVYNMPLSYRDRYYDTPNDWYRYNDGYIYRVDPTTQLITAVINAIV